MPQYLTGMRKQNTTLPTTTAPSATMLGGGRGASQAAQVQAINNQNAARQAAQEIAIKNAIANATKAVVPTTIPADTTPTDISINGGSGGSNGGNGGGTYQQSTAVVSDPYSDLYAIYQQKLDAQNAANEQRRAARLGALQSNYANAKSKLSDAFNSGETALNNDANNALRESYINMMLNQKRLNQQLESQGINGGAMESSLARAYNDYGNSRNNIEQGRMDALRELLSQYQGQLGDMESAYASNLADLDSDYFGNGLDFVTDYYNTIANLQAQNAASNLQAQLGKRSASTSTSSNASTDNSLNKDVLSIGKNYKGNGAGFKKYMDAIGIPEEQQNMYQLSIGNDPDGLDMVAPNVQNAVLSALKNVPVAMASNPPVQAMYINNLMQQLAAQYGLTEEQAKALLAEAGY